MSPMSWRLDEMGPNPANHARQVSGRKAVVALVLIILALWLGLDLAFRSWKARYNALAEFGASKVAPAIDPLARMIPPDVPPNDWRVAVDDTHAMLLALTGAGVLDQPQMERLRQEINQRVAQARPETAVKTLADLWDDLEKKAGPVIAPDSTPPPPNSRHAARNPRPARPKILGPKKGSGTFSWRPRALASSEPVAARKRYLTPFSGSTIGYAERIHSRCG